MGKYQFGEAEFALIESSCVPIAIYQFIDKRVVTVALSEGFCKLLGYERDEAYYLMDNDMYRDTHPDDVARMAEAALRFAVEDGDYNVVYRSKANGVYRIIHARGQHKYLEDGVRLAVVSYTDEGVYDTNATEFESGLSQALIKALHEETLLKRTSYDQLTGLPNMTYFFELAEVARDRMRAEGKNPALVYFNMSGMKFFNSKHGFAEGDELIKAVARVLAKYFGNDNCSRFSKDNFAAFTEEEGLEGKLTQFFLACKAINGGINLPIRAGIYLDSVEPVEIGTACDRAQDACNLNRDTYVSEYRYFNKAMLSKAVNRQYFIDNLDRAIDEGWIRVYYQAIVRAANGKVCDEEALARWIDPEKGLISPAEFIPVLEGAKLIYKLDLCVIDQVLAKMKEQADAGLYVVPQSVNLSRTDFESLDIVEAICNRVDAAGIPREKLTIEITESVVGSNFEFMKAQIERFRDLGFSVWMDDFGSGYSSLDVLQKIQFDVIKLDMRFLEDFDERDENKIILTELAKMAMGLGIETVAEGVETQEQVEFLREIGCNRLQGFYYTKPVSLEEIIERNKAGKQIGFENPDETEYFAAIGRINLYDSAVIAHDDRGSFQRYFDTIPMAIYEVSGDTFWVARTNKAYRDYTQKTFGINVVELGYAMTFEDALTSTLFLESVRQCSQDGKLVVIDEEIGEGGTTHSIIKRIAVNPVTGTAALIVAVLAVTGDDQQRAPVSYAHVAKALSSDYRYLYYVDLETEEFLEYSSSGSDGDLAIERHGDDFFRASRDDALSLLHEADREKFRKAFTKENVLATIAERGSFIITYRLDVDGAWRHMLMKAVRMAEDDTHIIIGVNDVDDQMKQREAFERVKSERLAYARISALAEQFICMYIVDLATENYEEFNASSEYDGLGFAKAGEHFFAEALANSEQAIAPEDRARFADVFTKEKVLKAIREYGRFDLSYHLLMDGKFVPVSLKAVVVQEPDGPRLVIGVQ